MARTKTKTNSRKTASQSLSVKRTTDKQEDIREEKKDQNFFDKFQYDLSHNQSYLNLILGALIVIVLGVLLFNYFTKKPGDLGPSGQALENPSASGDVAKENLPGKYTVKEGDTLFSIAQNYYNDGYKYTQIAKANNLSDENNISVGTVLDIPKTDADVAMTPASPSPSPVVTPAVSPAGMTADNSDNMHNTDPIQGATGGATNQTEWGEKITGDTYTVQAGDWLSKIAGRAYGDIMQYNKIAQANNISNPDSIEVGTVLKLPK